MSTSFVGAPSDSPIPVGKRHRTLSAVDALVFDYDSMHMETKRLLKGSIFQPWAPLDQWCRIRVPITLGNKATGFDWGVSSSEGHFLTWEDFFSLCELSEPQSDQSNPELHRPAVEDKQAAAGPFPTLKDASPVTSSKCWRLSNGDYLLQGAAEFLPCASPPSLRLSHGEVIHHATPFCVVTPQGRVTATYPAPSSYSLEDTLYIYDLYVVTDGQLCKVFWQQQWGYEERIEVQRVHLPDMVECDAKDLPFDAVFLSSH